MTIRFNATKKLVKGKRVMIEGRGSRWVFFKYEQLPNFYFYFYYQCGMLDHREKDCLDKMSTGNGDGEDCMQYGAWLKGEPSRHMGKDQGKMEEVNRPKVSSSQEETAVRKPTREKIQQDERMRVGEDHVDG